MTDPTPIPPGAARPVLAVLHKLGDSLSLFDVATGAELFTLGTNAFPHELCASPDRRKLYVTEYGLRGVETPGAGGNTVGVYDLRRRERVGTINLGEYRRPHGIALHQNSNGQPPHARVRLFVTSEPTGCLLILDAESGEVLHAVETGQQLPHITGVSPDGLTAYAANIGSGSLTMIDVKSGRVLAQVSVLKRPEGMAFSPDGGLLYVVNRESRAVAVVDTQERRMVGMIAAGSGPVRVVITPDGSRLAFPLFHADAVQIADTRTREVTHTVAVGRQPAGTAISPDGTLVFVSCEMERAVYVVSLVTHEVVGRISTGEGPDSMVCLDAADLD
jgi:YVTN family beta-propeller protein